ncbi:MAG: hypothetical protein M1823_001225 [Watsoniomyces obsoletus]|nr:MAG: hypothetical protein M1823_001225 [Watsoniomyces obsoletus]
MANNIAIETVKQSDSSSSQNSQTAAEYINTQLQLEADAKEALPYAFDTCTQPLGALRQTLYSCLTCNPPPSSPSDPYTAAGLCYSCSISCHGEHELVELFSKRNFVCDCGTTRLPSTSPCTLRIDPKTGKKGGGHSEPAAKDNKYNHNFRNRFCGCDSVYDPYEQNRTMYQCLGLGTVDNGGCGEDWYHTGCVVGLKPDWYDREKEEKKKMKEMKSESGDEKKDAEVVNVDQDEEEDDDDPVPPGFPEDGTFDTFICWKCVEAFPWIKRYAGTEGFLDPVFYDKPSIKGVDDGIKNGSSEPHTTNPDVTMEDEKSTSSNKRKADDDNESDSSSTKKLKTEHDSIQPMDIQQPACKYAQLPPIPQKQGQQQNTRMSIFLQSSFRDHLCHCPECFPKLVPHPELLEEEDTYEPPVSESGVSAIHSGASDIHTATGGSGTLSLLDRGEQALNNVDRVRAIEGVMVYNDLKAKVKAFLKPFAESGEAVGAEDIKTYFEKLRGDAENVKAANVAARVAGGGHGDKRKEQDGY